jgi:N-methylhydantoinase B
VLDPVTLEVVRNSFPAAANEMAEDLQRTSYNMMIYEVRDFSCAIVGADGELFAQNIGGVSHFVADLDVVIKDAVDRFKKESFKPGDAILMNHQRVCGQHLNNMVAYTPIFVGDELFGFSMVRAHWVDIGGLSTGFGAGGGMVTDPWVEGLQFDQVKIMDASVLNEPLMKFIADNVRYPEAAMGDLRAQLASCKVGAQRVEELVERYGVDVVRLCLERIFDDSEARCRLAVERIADGEYSAEGWLDHDFVDRGERVMIVAKVTVKGSDLTVDLTGSSRARRGSINARTRAAAFIAYKGITAPLEPLNEGSFRALHVEIDEGNFMMAKFPAPMAQWSIAIPTAVDVILRSLAPALPDVVPAGTYGTLGGAMVFFGNDPTRGGKRFVSQTIEGGGWGASPSLDGQNASVSVCQGDVRNAPIESLELKYPLLVEQRALRPDSGGAGRHRGGLGQVTDIQNLVAGTWSMSSIPRETCPPWGLHHGLAGQPGFCDVRLSIDGEWENGGDTRKVVGPGAAQRKATGGGGGWGDPLERPFEEIDLDLLEGFISRENAEQDYEVVVDPATQTVDREATRKLRAERGAARR